MRTNSSVGCFLRGQHGTLGSLTARQPKAFRPRQPDKPKLASLPVALTRLIRDLERARSSLASVARVVDITAAELAEAEMMRDGSVKADRMVQTRRTALARNQAVMARREARVQEITDELARMGWKG